MKKRKVDRHQASFELEVLAVQAMRLISRKSAIAYLRRQTVRKKRKAAGE